MVDANVSAAGDSPKKSPLSSINEEHQLSLLFFIVMSAWRMFVCFIWFSFLAGSFVHIFVRRSLETPHTTHSSRNSSEKIVFKLVNLFNKMSGQTRWSQISKKKSFSLLCVDCWTRLLLACARSAHRAFTIHTIQHVKYVYDDGGDGRWFRVNTRRTLKM